MGLGGEDGMSGVARDANNFSRAVFCMPQVFRITSLRRIAQMTTSAPDVCSREQSIDASHSVDPVLRGVETSFRPRDTRSSFSWGRFNCPASRRTTSMSTCAAAMPRGFAFLLFLTFTAHVCAVLFHTLVLRDRLLDRMAVWPTKSARPQQGPS